MSTAGKQPASARLTRELRCLPAAVSFLTRIPVGRLGRFDGADIARAGPFFPLVGAVIGAAVGAVATSLGGALSPLLAVALALAMQTLLTGALHLDALADTADALGARSRAHALQIMRDHTIGAYGAAAVGLDLLIKAAALAALARDGSALRFAIAAGALSRAAPVALAALLPYARAAGGTGASLALGGRPRAAVASAAAVLLAVAAAGVQALTLAAGAAAAVLVLGLGFRRWLGGVTGDTLGATVELTELVVLVGAAALARAA